MNFLSLFKQVLLWTTVGIVSYSIFSVQVKPFIRIISNFVAAGVFLAIKYELEIYGQQLIEWNFLRIFKYVPLELKVEIYKQEFLEQNKNLSW